jgi:hypothetical protein
VRSWKYTERDLDAFDEAWYLSKRKNGSTIVDQYIRPLPVFRSAADELMQRIKSATPRPTLVLGVHARGTDKADGRRLIDIGEYVAYANAFLSALPASVAGKIFLATDDIRFSTAFSQSNISQYLFHFNQTKLSSSKVPTFKAYAKTRNVVNAEVLKDIVMLSKCDYLLHGHSTVSESAIYLNFKLHSQSVNIEYSTAGRRYTAEGFSAYVGATYPSILLKR